MTSTKLTITDLHGHPQEITDLDRAIQQAAEFKEYTMPTMPILEANLKAYWTDLHRKLVNFKNQIS